MVSSGGNCNCFFLRKPMLEETEIVSFVRNLCWKKLELFRSEETYAGRNWNSFSGRNLCWKKLELFLPEKLEHTGRILEHNHRKPKLYVTT